MGCESTIDQDVQTGRRYTVSSCWRSRIPAQPCRYQRMRKGGSSCNNGLVKPSACGVMEVLERKERAKRERS